MNSASQVLGISRKTIDVVMNYREHYVNCPGIEERCMLYEPHMPTKVGSPYANPYLRPKLEGIDYSQLPHGKILAFTENYELRAQVLGE